MIRRSGWGLSVALMGLVCSADQAAAPRSIEACLATKPKARLILPSLFREVSGLALSDDGRLWVHNDEQGIVGAIDRTSGALLGSYQLGPSLPRGDFEGVAIAGTKLFLVTSDGILFGLNLPATGTKSSVVPYETIETGVGKACEIEGLAYEPSDRTLLMACKTPRAKSLAGVTAIFRWSVPSRQLAAPDRIEVSWKDLSKDRKGKAFHASAIERDPATGHYLLLSSADRAFGVIDRTGRVLQSGPIGPHHPQPEGLAIGADGSIYVSDEGGKGPGTVAVYSCR